MAVRTTADSAFGCAGQRCLATSLAITVGEAHNPFVEMICDTATDQKVGYGLDEEIQMGTVINPASQKRIEELISVGVSEGAGLPVDRRGNLIPGYEGGSFLRPTILRMCNPEARSPTPRSSDRYWASCRSRVWMRRSP